MPRPFPGIDPFLEDSSLWMDFHKRFITYCSDFLNVRLPVDYDTRIGSSAMIAKPVTISQTNHDEFRESSIQVSDRRNHVSPAVDIQQTAGAEAG